MAGLSSIVDRFSDTYHKTDGTPFFGAVLPAEEGVTNAMLPAKLILRCLLAARVAPRDVIRDAAGRRYLVAQLDVRRTYKTFRLFEINADPMLKRTTVEKDKLTGLARSTKAAEIGTFPAMIQFANDRPDGAIRVSEQSRIIVTGERLQVGDIVDEAVVRWVVETLGVTHGEIR